MFPSLSRYVNVSRSDFISAWPDARGYVISLAFLAPIVLDGIPETEGLTVTLALVVTGEIGTPVTVGLVVTVTSYSPCCAETATDTEKLDPVDPAVAATIELILAL